MHRRTFLTASAAALLAPFAARAATDYTPGLVKQHLAKGDIVFLDFSATWCATCATQERVVNELIDENPAYGETITFIKVDWDTYRKAELTKSLKIPRRSTLVVLKGDQELGRIVAGTSKSQIKGLLDTALSAANA
ncbi:MULTISPECIES: thioredoxin family protein [unclassified Shimia]|uniref:thioredoxin family protein n=1 Tax=unclassified Shimia TaxID=2630038 RepID=UPI001ADA17BE|nr:MULTISPECIES: thioredoxin family protein [unclassified Shimia]MBO9473797.1 thioredoxin family protein [Shimia sp. R10_1]MDA5557466.1 thioredoxin family protein [Shimia sp. MMG029]